MSADAALIWSSDTGYAVQVSTALRVWVNWHGATVQVCDLTDNDFTERAPHWDADPTVSDLYTHTERNY